METNQTKKPTRQAIYERKKKYDRATHGLCLDCPNPRGVGHKRCHECNVKRREANKIAKQRSRARLGGK